MESRGHTIVAFCTVAIQHVSESKVFRCLSGYDQVEGEFSWTLLMVITNK